METMERSLILLFFLIATCSVWTVHSRTLEIDIDEDEQEDMGSSMEAQALPGVCWACKRALNKVKKIAGPNATAESLKSKLLSVCDGIVGLKRVCRRFVKHHLRELINELMTTDDVRTICVKARACKPKQTRELILNPNKETKRRIETNNVS